MLNSAKFRWSKLQLNQAITRAVVALMAVLHKEECQEHVSGQMSWLTKQGVSLLRYIG